VADSAADADRKAQNNDLKEPLFLQDANLAGTHNFIRRLDRGMCPEKNAP